MVTEIVGEGLVPLIEKGSLYSPEILNLLKQFTKPMLENNIDRLVLGCSHYPYLIPQLTELLPSHIKIIDSGKAVAKQTKYIVFQNSLQKNTHNKHRLQFISNSTTTTLKFLLEDYLDEIQIETKIF